MEDEEINSALLSAVSVDEAANNIMDAKVASISEVVNKHQSSTSSSASKIGDGLTMGKILPPKDLDCFLN